jgi:hypothetical protein
MIRRLLSRIPKRHWPIPKGIYCYNRNKLCPYWSLNKDHEYQNNGYCSLLKSGDWETSKEKGHWRIRQSDGSYKEVIASGEEMGLFTGLLWDQVKECGINEW